MYGYNKCLLVLFVIYLVAYQASSLACTSWATLSNTGQSIFMAKNRDRTFKYPQSLRMFRGEKHDFFALTEDRPTANGEQQHLVKAGINDRGLAVVSLGAATLPESERRGSVRSVMAEILFSYETVAEVLQHANEIFPKSKPKFYGLVDRARFVYVEVGKDGEFKVLESPNSPLFHTNHFLSPELAKFNVRPYPSSTIRLQTVKELMERAAGGFDFEKFISIRLNRDHCSDNSDNCIFRIKSASSESIQTIASWIIEIPKSGPPHLVVYLLKDPLDDKWTSHSFDLTHEFWKSAYQNQRDAPCYRITRK